ncbi:MAG: DUF951 domain-containing protein [Clostridia bacterium]|nr:DUF951 domain-containing protein [Clostridia bacterium]
MDLSVGDLVTLKKPHPCGSRIFRLTRVGMDLKLVCTTCGHEILMPRKKAEKSIRAVSRGTTEEGPDV